MRASPAEGGAQDARHPSPRPPARVLVTTNAALDEHDLGQSHPERPARLGAALAGVRDAHLGDDVAVHEPRLATRAEVERVHDPAHLDELEQLCAAGGGMLDADTGATPGSWATALAAAGCGLVAIDALAGGAAASRARS